MHQMLISRIKIRRRRQLFILKPNHIQLSDHLELRTELRAEGYLVGS